MKKVLLVAGARPNFMKIAPILRAFENCDDIAAILVHTGQHYDQNMSGAFFEELSIKKPDFYLDVGSGSHAVQTAEIMKKFETICIEEKPDMVVVVGDVNSTIATGLVAKKLHIKLAHVEAGLRSGDRDMPEEINRLATDAISDIFFTTEESGTQNLLAEGHSKDSIHFVGHVMIDNLFFQLQKINLPETLSSQILALKTLLPQKYLCMTLHRPSNVDDENTLIGLLNTLKEIAQDCPIIFPCHPRTLKQIEKFGLGSFFISIENVIQPIDNGIILCEPLGYNDFLYLWHDSVAVLTDSGGLQEETTALKKPCLTLRDSTERPITVNVGSNELIGSHYDRLKNEIDKIKNDSFKKGEIPALWDGQASERIVNVVHNYLIGVSD